MARDCPGFLFSKYSVIYFCLHWGTAGFLAPGIIFQHHIRLSTWLLWLQRGPTHMLQFKHMKNCSKKSGPTMCAAGSVVGAFTAPRALQPPPLLTWFSAGLPPDRLTIKSVSGHTAVPSDVQLTLPRQIDLGNKNMLISKGKNHKAGKEQLASLKDKGEALFRHFSCIIYAVDILL